MRIDKLLCEMSVGTRSEVKKLIAKGLVTVNGAVVRDAGMHVAEETAGIAVDGRPVSYQRYEYYLLNKPAGVISASRSDLRSKSERCVVDLIEGKSRKDLFPVGRLDKDTEGLLLITNDGALAHRLLSPKRHVWKCYYAELSGPVSDEALLRLSEGVEIGDETPTLPCRVARTAFLGRGARRKMPDGDGRAEGAGVFEAEGAGEQAEASAPAGQAAVLITIREGRYHQIKRMAEAVGNRVTYLRRLSMGSLLLPETLPEGAFRKLTEAEISALAEGKSDADD